MVAPSVAASIMAFGAHNPDIASRILVSEIDPAHADTEVLTREWGTALFDSVNCVLVAGRRHGVERLAACCVRATTRANVNHTIKRRLDVRKCSFLHMEAAVERTGMEYGAITPLGLDSSWPVWLDPLVLGGPAIIGSGLRTSKIRLPGTVLALFPGVEVVEHLAIEPAPSVRH
nr:YbaK/EbsC family protein [Flaviflexus huanghaiensis]